MLEFSGAEYMVRGRGYLKNVKDLEDIAVGASVAGTPIYLKDVARVQLGPEIRGDLRNWTAREKSPEGLLLFVSAKTFSMSLSESKTKLKMTLRRACPRV